MLLDDIRKCAIYLGEKYPNAVYVRPATRDGSLSGGGCHYTKGDIQNGPPGSCGCIFGQALRMAGFSQEFLLNSEGWFIAQLLQACFGGSVNDYKDFKAAQDLQDSGRTWGVCAQRLREGITCAVRTPQ